MDLETLKASAAPHLRKFYPKTVDLNFSGTTPPELFVGEAQYPNVYAGILSPTTHDDESSTLTKPELWYQKKLSINDILFLRSSLIYARFKTPIKNFGGRLIETMQEVSMSIQPTAVSFELKKKPRENLQFDARHPPIGNAAPVIKTTLEDNPVIPRKIDRLVNDTDAKATTAIEELYKSNFDVTNIMKLLSAGLLGIKKARKLTPTKWSITAVDSLLSKKHLNDIRTYQPLSTYEVYHQEYLGNHYEILYLPRTWSYEVIEHSLPSQAYPTGGFWTDQEGYKNRTTYADSVVGAYYANRLAVTEHLKRKQRQATVIIFREVKPEYWAPCGVGILRETVRDAFKKPGEQFNTLPEALHMIQTRLQTPINEYLKNSKLYHDVKEQRTLLEY
ncbi:MAG: hypothetical protein Q7R56_00110 [Nanoarchaeota archaeon]|nr:hypothetical protein [Nanoarchaeota archaeon]